MEVTFVLLVICSAFSSFLIYLFAKGTKIPSRPYPHLFLGSLFLYKKFIMWPSPLPSSQLQMSVFIVQPEHRQEIPISFLNNKIYRLCQRIKWYLASSRLCFVTRLLLLIVLVISIWLNCILVIWYTLMSVDSVCVFCFHLGYPMIWSYLGGSTKNFLVWYPCHKHEWK